MRKILTDTKTALRTVFQTTTYKLILAVSFVVFLTALVMLPVWLTPGNTIAYQLSLMTVSNWVLMTFLSILISVLISMQIYLLARKKKRVSSISEGSVSVGSVLFSGILGSATCTSCLITVLPFVGFGNIVWIVQHRVYWVIGTIVLTLIALYLAVRRINNNCEVCGDAVKQSTEE